MAIHQMSDYEALPLPQVQQFKSRLFDHISVGDDIMEIGIGSGPNLKYYADKSIGKLMALEPNREFDQYIGQNVAKSNLQTKVDIVAGVAESIPKADNSVDVVVGTMVMCSVSSVKQSLAEVYRILKPGGRYIYTEHIAAPETAKALTFAQQLADPLQQALAEGCHLRRDPEHEIVQTFGQDNVNSERFVLPSDDILPPHFLLSPHLIGVATKS